ncbi:hypothetical protein PACTADRAFT_4335 [Pachysolen tannophilus NRRL Y-2460]|uniref:Pre-mRNA-splicing factor CWC26 n=1 Tax=Pachysolen tannophilus NRRL Y-2460 TaxID=669874 RepID=A0A1E4TRK5_PACTA|nr:hypothetical protein PACTADRAFT_4335 [Pachysolen tannophilus NRRL Y-2460]
MSSSLADYLAKNYLGTDSKKKRKTHRDKESRDEKKLADTTIITTEDRAPINNIHNNLQEEESQVISGVVDNDGDEDEDEEGPLKIKSRKIVKKNLGWKKVKSGDDHDNKIIRPKADVTTEISEKAKPKLESGAAAGLHTGAEVSEAIRLKQDQEYNQYLETLGDVDHNNEETIHRDAKGNIIDIKKLKELRKQEISVKRAKLLEEQEQIKSLNKDLLKDLDQRQEFEKLQKLKSMNVYKDDLELNLKQTSQLRTDDPLLMYDETKAKELQKGRYRSRTGRKLYKHPYPENRFNIAPGWRWDGIDRSNGFERKWFDKQSEINTKKILNYTMQEDY